MSNATRLQFGTGIVRGDRLWGVNYAMGQSFAYGATCPGHAYTSTATLALAIAKLRARYVGIRFRGEADNSSGDLQVKIHINGAEVKHLNLAATDRHDYLYIHDADANVGDSMLVEVEIWAISGANSFLSNVVVYGMRDNHFPARFSSDIFMDPD